MPWKRRRSWRWVEAPPLRLPSNNIDPDRLGMPGVSTTVGLLANENEVEAKGRQPREAPLVTIAVGSKRSCKADSLERLPS